MTPIKTFGDVTLTQHELGLLTGVLAVRIEKLRSDPPNPEAHIRRANAQYLSELFALYAHIDAALSDLIDRRQAAREGV